MAKYRYKASNPRAGGLMTLSQYEAMLKNCLRGVHRTWSGANQAKLASRDGSKVVNPATGRECIAHICNVCGAKLMDKEVEIDHIESFVPLDSTWHDMINSMTFIEVCDRLFGEKDAYQVLCSGCHYGISQAQNEFRRLSR